MFKWILELIIRVAIKLATEETLLSVIENVFQKDIDKDGYIGKAPSSRAIPQAPQIIPVHQQDNYQRVGSPSADNASLRSDESEHYSTNHASLEVEE